MSECQVPRGGKEAVRGAGGTPDKGFPGGQEGFLFCVKMRAPGGGEVEGTTAAEAEMSSSEDSKHRGLVLRPRVST